MAIASAQPPTSIASNPGEEEATKPSAQSAQRRLCLRGQGWLQT